MNENYIDKTIDGLSNIKNDDSLLGEKGFRFTDFDTYSKNAVLIMGLNPAGNENDRNRETKCEQFKCFSDELNKSQKNLSKNCFIYPKYFSPIMEMVEGVFGKGNAKWDWCNATQKQVEGYYHVLECYAEERDFPLNKEDKEAFVKYWESTKRLDCDTSIFVGDMFYYYKTSSTEIKKIATTDPTYYETMLEEHVNALKDKTNLRFVYINNAFVSSMLRDGKEKNKSFKEMKFGEKTIPVFFGSMLSNAQMDNASKGRLIKEIRHVLELDSGIYGD